MDPTELIALIPHLRLEGLLVRNFAQVRRARQPRRASRCDSIGTIADRRRAGRAPREVLAGASNGWRISPLLVAIAVAIAVADHDAPPAEQARIDRERARSEQRERGCQHSEQNVEAL